MSRYVEVGVSKDSRPRKRLCGGGFGDHPGTVKRDNRTHTYRQIGRKNSDKRQFAR